MAEQNGIPCCLYRVTEVAILKTPLIGAVEWRIAGWRWRWQAGTASVEDGATYLAVASFATPELAIAFSIGWHARGVLFMDDSKRDE